MFKRPLLPGLIWTLLIAVLTLMPGNYIPKVFTFLDWLSPDKIIHLVLFGVYAFLLAAGFSRMGKPVLMAKHPMLSGLIIGIVFAIFTEVMQKFSDPPLSQCELCHGKMRKLISQSTFHLKGTGWYVTDYASKTGGNQGKSSGAEHRGESDKPKAAAESSQKGDSSKVGESSKDSKKKDSPSK